MSAADLPALCWCGQQTVFVTVKQVRAGSTDACGRPGCREGCEMVDLADEEVPEAPGIWELIWAPGMCLCGCGEITTGKSRYRMGHDARAKSQIRQRQPRAIHLIDPETSAVQVHDARDWLVSMSTPRFDWTTLIQA